MDPPTLKTNNIRLPLNTNRFYLPLGIPRFINLNTETLLRYITVNPMDEPHEITNRSLSGDRFAFLFSFISVIV